MMAYFSKYALHKEKTACKKKRCAYQTSGISRSSQITTAHATSRGFSFLETLIALTICSAGVLALIDLQFKSIRTTHQAYLNNQAILLLQDLAGRMRSNRQASLEGVYLTDDAKNTKQNCINKLCTPQEMAQFDQQQWLTRAQKTLPEANYTLQFNKNYYTLTLYWFNPLGDSNCKDAEVNSPEISCTSLEVHL